MVRSTFFCSGRGFSSTVKSAGSAICLAIFSLELETKSLAKESPHSGTDGLIASANASHTCAANGDHFSWLVEMDSHLIGGALRNVLPVGTGDSSQYATFLAA